MNLHRAPAALDAPMVAVIRSRPGMVPTSIDAVSGSVVWRDVGRHHFTAHTFGRGVERAHREIGRPIVGATTLAVLDGDGPGLDTVPPTGFVFHVGRSGSSLLVKALASVDDHLVISEAAPHNEVWASFGDVGIDGCRLNATYVARYRNLVLATGRRRRPEYRLHFVKFTSWNLFHLDAIRDAFPDVPCLLLYRDPSAIVRSLLARPPSWMGVEESRFGRFLLGAGRHSSMSEEEFACRIVRRLTEAAVTATAAGVVVLDHAQLTPKMLPRIARTFRTSWERDELDLMTEQFGWYSKRDDGQPYVPDPAGAAVGSAAWRDAVGHLVYELDRSPRNLAHMAAEDEPRP